MTVTDHAYSKVKVMAMVAAGDRQWSLGKIGALPMSAFAASSEWSTVDYQTLFLPFVEQMRAAGIAVELRESDAAQRVRTMTLAQLDRHWRAAQARHRGLAAPPPPAPVVGDAIEDDPLAPDDAALLEAIREAAVAAPSPSGVTQDLGGAARTQGRRSRNRKRLGSSSE